MIRKAVKKTLLFKISYNMKETLNEALKTGGDVLMKFFNQPLTHKTKESQSSIVTEADYASDLAITGLIRKKHPDHNILSEESGFTDNGSEYTWVVDPLDGTSNFAAGIPWFGVLITLFRGQEPFMGGAFLPITGTSYFTEKGKGAFKNNVPLPGLDNKNLKNSLFAFSVDYTEDLPFLNRGIEIYKYIIKNSRNIRSTNCLFDFLYVAEGKFGGMINLYTRVWDIAGLCLMINETGGVVQNIHGNPIVYNLSQAILTEDFPIVAGNKSVVDALNRDILIPS
jgi:myo-inositol-1(or 4)-monophosphatase